MDVRRALLLADPDTREWALGGDARNCHLRSAVLEVACETLGAAYKRVSAERDAEKKNEPLTMEELRGMDGRPVTRSGFTSWALVNAGRKSEFYTINSDGGTLRESGYMIGPGNRSKYSIGWVAYRRPPKEVQT